MAHCTHCNGANRWLTAHIVMWCIPAFCSRASIPALFHPAGVGFVGRHLAALLVEGALASHIRVVDKAPPATGWLNEYHKVSSLLPGVDPQRARQEPPFLEDTSLELPFLGGRIYNRNASSSKSTK